MWPVPEEYESILPKRSDLDKSMSLMGTSLINLTYGQNNLTKGNRDSTREKGLQKDAN